MTRINVVPPAELGPLHLTAEYRELPRVFRLAASRAERGLSPEADRARLPHYRLGEGHVLFFVCRLEWAAQRHALLCGEMLRRGWQANLQGCDVPWRGIIPASFWHGWDGPREEDLALNRARIRDRWSGVYSYTLSPYVPS